MKSPQTKQWSLLELATWRIRRKHASHYNTADYKFSLLLIKTLLECNDSLPLYQRWPSNIKNNHTNMVCRKTYPPYINRSLKSLHHHSNKSLNISVAIIINVEVGQTQNVRRETNGSWREINTWKTWKSLFVLAYHCSFHPFTCNRIVPHNIWVRTNPFLGKPYTPISRRAHNTKKSSGSAYHGGKS